MRGGSSSTSAAATGNDNLDGGDGADLIAGEAGNDTITPDDNPLNTRDVALGGDGDDAMIWNGGDDDDVNDGGAGNDTVTVNGARAAGGVHAERVGDRGSRELRPRGDARARPVQHRHRRVRASST